MQNCDDGDQRSVTNITPQPNDPVDDLGKRGSIPMKRDRNAVLRFPDVLFEIIHDQKNSEMIKWIANTDSFVIQDKQMFSEKILPSYYKQTKFESFTRQLSRWGFKRASSRHNSWIYYHEYFKPNRQDLCNLIQYSECKEIQEPKKRRHNNEKTSSSDPSPLPSTVSTNYIDMSIRHLNNQENNGLTLKMKDSRQENGNSEGDILREDISDDESIYYEEGDLMERGYTVLAKAQEQINCYYRYREEIKSSYINRMHL